MSLESIIAQYGYVALIFGTALEGETILVIAGYLAHRGYLHLNYVIAAAAFGTFVGDQIFFQLGRQLGAPFLARHPHWQGRADRVRRLLDRHRTLLVMSFRFIYGIRTVTPFVIGMSGFPRKVFVPLNAASAGIWATVIGCAGYAFGKVFEHALNDARRFEKPVVLSMVGTGLVIWLWRSGGLRQKQ